MSKKNILDAPIKFEGYKIESIQYGKDFDPQDTDFNLGCSISDDLKSANVKIKIDFDDEHKESHGQIEVVGHFSLNESLTEDEIKPLVFQNGAAILYPYVRTMISMITALDDSRVNVMPTLNFVEMFKDYEQEEK